MPKKRFSVEQSLTLLRQIRVCRCHRTNLRRWLSEMPAFRSRIKGRVPLPRDFL